MNPEQEDALFHKLADGITQGPRPTRRLIACAVVLAAGVLGMVFLISLRKAPAAAVREERALSVEGLAVYPETAQVWLRALGAVKALNEVNIAPEVAGRVVEVHPRLEAGEVIPAGETLFAIDPRDYEARLSDARASVAQLEQTLERLRAEQRNYGERLKTSKRSQELARAEYERIKDLFDKDQVGTRSGVDAAERALNTQSDQTDQLARAVETYPIQIQEAQSGLEAARARFELAQLNLERTRVVAPFNARIKMVQIEKDQYVAPGAPVLTLADDSVLEIEAPLDSREARHWLQFDGERVAESKAWFSGLRPVACEIRWTEDKGGHAWPGRLHRVVRFDETTRTLTVAIRVEGAEAAGRNGSLPLVEGMFCEVLIPGREMDGVYRLPRWAVSFENQAYLAVDNRLRKVNVEVARAQGDDVFVSGGLNPGDFVITTRLVNPLENSLLEIQAGEKQEPAAS